MSDSGIDYVVKHPNIIKVLKSILIDRADEIVNLDEEYTIKAILKNKYRKNIPLYKIIPPQVMDNFVKENTDIETLDGCIDYCVQMKRNLSHGASHRRSGSPRVSRDRDRKSVV